MTNWDIINIVQSVLNKDLNGMAFKISEYQQMINAASLKLFVSKLGLTSEYQREVPIARQGVAVSQKVDNDLLPFLRSQAISAVGGVVSLTGLGVAYIDTLLPNPHVGRGFDVLSLYELPERLRNAITAPTEEDPIVVRDGLNKLTIYPSTLTGVTMYYYVYPRQAVIAVTRNTTTLAPEYDSGNSIELEWDDANKVEIAYLVLRDAGVNIERQDVLRYAETVIDKGK